MAAIAPNRKFRGNRWKDMEDNKSEEVKAHC